LKWSFAMLAFVHIHKTAGITINWVLRRSFGLQHCDVEPWKKNVPFFSANDYLYLRKLYSRTVSIAGHKVRAYSDLDQVCPNIKYYTFLREPIIRFVSHYQYTVQFMKVNIPLDTWLNKDEVHNYQIKRIVGTDDLDAAIKMVQEKFMFVGLVEHFDESLIMLQRKSDDYKLKISYRNKNVSSNNSIKNRILSDPKILKKIESANRIDLEFYKFVTQELYQKYKSEYGPTLDKDVINFKKTNTSPDINKKLLLNLLKRRLLYRPIVHCYRFFRDR
jgi:Galactose-3-O-sulfotransferase